MYHTNQKVHVERTIRLRPLQAPASPPREIVGTPPSVPTLILRSPAAEPTGRYVMMQGSFHHRLPGCSLPQNALPCRSNIARNDIYSTATTQSPHQEKHYSRFPSAEYIGPPTHFPPTRSGERRARLSPTTAFHAYLITDAARVATLSGVGGGRWIKYIGTDPERSKTAKTAKVIVSLFFLVCHT